MKVTGQSIAFESQRQASVGAGLTSFCPELRFFLQTRITNDLAGNPIP